MNSRILLFLVLRSLHIYFFRGWLTSLSCSFLFCSSFSSLTNINALTGSLGLWDSCCSFLVVCRPPSSLKHMFLQFLFPVRRLLPPWSDLLQLSAQDRLLKLEISQSDKSHRHRPWPAGLSLLCPSAYGVSQGCSQHPRCFRYSFLQALPSCSLMSCRFTVALESSAASVRGFASERSFLVRIPSKGDQARAQPPSLVSSFYLGETLRLLSGVLHSVQNQMMMWHINDWQK